MSEIDYSLLVVITLVVSLLAGSFLNVLIHRLPKMLTRPDQTDASFSVQDRFNLWVPRSHCPLCRVRIPIPYLMPVLSWLLLRGHCRECGGTISARYPLVELAAPLLAFLAFAQFGWTLSTLPLIGCLWLLLALAVMDFETGLLPDSATYLLLWSGLLMSALFSDQLQYVDTVSSVLGAIAGYSAFRFLYEAFRLLTGRESMGFGDFKLAAAAGAWLGFSVLLHAVILASFLGLCVGLVLLAVGRYSRTEGIPFAPFLALSTGLALLYGSEMGSFAATLQHRLLSVLSLS